MDSPLLEKSDEDLAVLAQGNNAEAFGVLMSRYQAKLLRYGRRFLARSEHIEDVVQDVFVRTYQNIQDYDSSLPFRPWIYRIAHNAFVNALRQSKRDPIPYFDLDTLTAHTRYEIDPAEEEDRVQMQKLVDTGLESLAPRYREVLVLYYLENLGYQEIADVLHIPVGTVGIRLRRAREALKKFYGNQP